MSDLNSFYLTLSSDSSVELYRGNTIAQFCTQLSQPIVLQDTWEVGLFESFLPPGEEGYKSEAHAPIFLYTDLIRPQIVCDTVARLLRILPPNTKANQHSLFNTIYLPLEKNNFSSINISLLSKSGKKYPFVDSVHPAILVLHFRKVN